MSRPRSRATDAPSFEALFERHRGELRVHCYRMLGSFEEAEDLVQETFLRAWKNLGSFEGRSSVRAWLYRIATNACLDVLGGRAHRVLPNGLSAPWAPGSDHPARTDIEWLQPFPDRLCEPDTAAVDRETLELAFLAAIQHLPPKQRAVLILRDVLGWPAKDTATLLDTTVAAANSALQRARATLKEHLPERRADWAPSATPTDEERSVLRRYMAAMERADLAGVAEVLAEDVRTMMPPWPMWFVGADAVLSALAESWDPGSPYYRGRFRMLPTRANGRPAVATYVRDDVYRPFALSVLRIENGVITEAVAFHDPGLFPAFDLPPTLDR